MIKKIISSNPRKHITIKHHNSETLTFRVLQTHKPSFIYWDKKGGFHEVCTNDDPGVINNSKNHDKKPIQASLAINLSLS